MAKGTRVEAIFDAFVDNDRRDAFFEFYRELEELYEIISPDAFLRPFLADYALLAEMYSIVLEAGTPVYLGIADLAKKTAGLVRERVASGGVYRTTKPVLLDDKALAALQKDAGAKPGKVINLAKTLARQVAAEKATHPYLIPIGDRVEGVLESYDDRQITTEEMVQKVAKLVAEYLEASKEQVKLGLDAGTFAIYRELKREEVPDPKNLAVVLNGAFQHHAHYRDDGSAKRALKTELYRLLLPVVGKDKMVGIVERLLGVWRSGT